jgi:hypothetical protein
LQPLKKRLNWQFNDSEIATEENTQAASVATAVAHHGKFVFFAPDLFCVPILEEYPRDPDI